MTETVTEVGPKLEDKFLEISTKYLLIQAAARTLTPPDIIQIDPKQYVIQIYKNKSSNRN